jgi:fructose-1,6-bisphosphatase
MSLKSEGYSYLSKPGEIKIKVLFANIAKTTNIYESDLKKTKTTFYFAIARSVNITGEEERRLDVHQEQDLLGGEQYS